MMWRNDVQNSPHAGREGRRPGAHLVSDITDTHEEYPGDGRAANVKHVQKGILRILDDHRAADILDRIKRQG